MAPIDSLWCWSCPRKSHRYSAKKLRSSNIAANLPIPRCSEILPLFQHRWTYIDIGAVRHRKSPDLSNGGDSISLSDTVSQLFSVNHHGRTDNDDSNREKPVFGCVAITLFSRSWRRWIVDHFCLCRLDLSPLTTADLLFLYLRQIGSILDIRHNR